MTQAVIISIVPFAGAYAHRVNDVLDGLANPAVHPIARTLNKAQFVHFMSMSVIQEDREETAHLVLEASVDGAARPALQRIARTIDHALLSVLRAAGEQVSREKLGAFLERHRRNVGAGWLSTPGVTFVGTPGLSVQRIRKEARLAAWMSKWLEDDSAAESALSKLERMRSEVFKHADLKWAFVAEGTSPSTGRIASKFLVLLSAVRYLLWPLFIVALVGALISGAAYNQSPGRIGLSFVLVLIAGITVTLFTLAAVYIMQRWQERGGLSKDEAPQAGHVARLMARENMSMQNHVTGVSTLKPGGRLLLHFVFWLVDVRARYAPRPGFLSGIGTIHFASWSVLPRGRLLFLSNYDGSWLSYLEDFIAQAHRGLTAIWSNSRDFPKTTGLFEDGANDGERFKRWSRRQQRPTGFWYSAYPDLTTTRIRRNAEIRCGFASAMSEVAAADWLTLFGFPPRRNAAMDRAPPRADSERVVTKSNPPSEPVKVQSEQIPTLAFGGLSGWQYSHCLIVALNEAKPAAACTWLREIEQSIAYGMCPKDHSVPVIVGFTVDGLRKLRLDEAVIEMFPSAFQHGMAAPWRSRALGDAGVNAPEKWLWGGPRTRCDAIVVLYANDHHTLKKDVSSRSDRARKHGHNIVHEIELAALPQKGVRLREQFGFVDGISQPVMRRTPEQDAQYDSMELIAPGELVLGYSDNRGYVSPSPRLGDFDVGLNGTFLVVRQLEQDVAAFQRYLDAEAARLAAAWEAGDSRVPTADEKELRRWIGAKMVGRWEDGTSLVRNPRGRGNCPIDNDFRFGEEDPYGLCCPFGSHIRRANPRDSLAPASHEQIDITNQHRILRVGRPYGPQNGSKDPGLMFMCVNTDIEGQFEFLQQTWLLGRSFHGLQDEVDHVVGQCRRARREGMSIPTPYGPLRLRRMQNFITVRGGGYFFLPSSETISLLLHP